MPSPDIDPQTPHAARIWNYWMGGKDHYKVDRAAGDAVARVYPDIVVLAQQSRRFLIRVVRYLTRDAGIRQFLDIGTGLPTMQNTHEVAQQIAPACRVVYVDNDPLVLAHARALLINTSAEGVTTYVHADYHEPDVIVGEASNVLNLTKPVAVMFMGVLGYELDLAGVRSIVSRVMEAVPSGSYLALWDSTNTSPAVVEGAEQLKHSGGAPYALRRPDELGSCFDGLEMVEPGLVPITHWRPYTAEGDTADTIDAYGAVARKP